MAYRYRCRQCRTTSQPVAKRAQLDPVRERHRALAHSGLIPDGESTEWVPVPQRFSWRTALGAFVLLWLAVLDWVASHLF